jgi:hypothetical protein
MDGRSRAVPQDYLYSGSGAALGVRGDRLAVGGEVAQGYAEKDEREAMTKHKVKNVFPRGWDEKKVQELIAHHEGQTDDEAAAEDEAAFSDKSFTVMQIPVELVAEVDELLVRRASRPRLSRSSRRAPPRPRSSSKSRAAGGRR